MINTITITNHLNESITINMRNPEESSGFFVRYIDGLGPPKANVEMTEMALMDGAYYNSARATSRNIVMGLGFNDYHEISLAPVQSSEDVYTIYHSIEEIRQKSYKYFPLKQRIKLSFVADNRVCEIYGYVESNDPDIFSKTEGTVISIRCPNSYFLSPEIDITEFATVEPRFEFPFSNESTTLKLLEFSEISGYTTQNIYNSGDTEVGMVMRLHAIGDVENPEIFKLEPLPTESIKINSATLIALTGYGIHVGDDIIISTVKGNKYVRLLRDGNYINILNCIDMHPDWIQLSRGDNIFTYTADSGLLNLQFTIESQISYEGI